MNECVSSALKRTFSNLDENFYKKGDKMSSKCGSTAVVVFIMGNHIFCANIGDSRAALCRSGKVINLSYDHKPQRPDEVERIQNNQGFI